MGLTLPADMWDHGATVQGSMHLGQQMMHPDGTAEAIPPLARPTQDQVADALAAASGAVGIDGAGAAHLRLVKDSNEAVHPEIAALNIAHAQAAVETHEASAQATQSVSMDRGPGGPGVT